MTQMCADNSKNDHRKARKEQLKKNRSSPQRLKDTKEKSVHHRGHRERREQHGMYRKEHNVRKEKHRGSPQRHEKLASSI
jgi:hypothetical protein